ncbi:hypothetical protein GCM10020000_77090 [Streptomyces olivoverticillatus]
MKKVVALHVEQRPRPDDGVIVFEDADAFLLPVHHRGHWLFSYTCPPVGRQPPTPPRTT